MVPNISDGVPLFSRCQVNRGAENTDMRATMHAQITGFVANRDAYPGRSVGAFSAAWPGCDWVTPREENPPYPRDSCSAAA
ncbi:hypothetical protein SALBM135S_00844 [Streptomyces alboniger]